MDENKRLKVWIIVLCCLLALFAGYIFYLEYNKDVNTNAGNSSEIEENKDEESKIEILKMNKVEELVKKYIYIGNDYSSDSSLKFYFGDNSEGTIINYNLENMKLNIAINNTDSIKIHDCSTIANDDIVLDGEWYSLKDDYYVCYDDVSSIYDYNDVNLNYKLLFGSDEQAPKKSISMNKYYYYMNGQYISLFQHDDSLWPDGQISKITDFEQDGKDLEVTVSYLYNSEYDVMPVPEINDEIINDMFNTRNDYSYQFKMFFEFENDHFVLKNINKII